MKTKASLRFLRILKKLFLILFGITSSVVILELICRLFFTYTAYDIDSFRPSFYHSYNSDRRRFKSHPFLPYFSRPFDSRTVYYYKEKHNKDFSYSYTNNSLGFRTPERPFKKPPNTKRIIALGGSTTWDGPTNELTWPAILEKKLQEHYKNTGYTIEVFNLALDAGNAAISLGILQMFGIEYEPDLVISYDGVNDVYFNLHARSILPDYSNFMQSFDDAQLSVQLLMPRRAFDSYVVSIVATTIDKILGFEYLPEQIWRVVPTTSDKYYENGTPLYFRTLRLMRSTCREYECTFVASIPHWAEVDGSVYQFDSTVRPFLNKENINYLDLQKALPHNDYSIHSDVVHWTEKGLDMMADAWKQKIISENLLGLER